MENRRLESRVACVLDATWSGQSGAHPCRVTDLSWHGCFVQSSNAPGVGHETLVTMTFGGEQVALRGRVQYVELRMGFAVTFDGSIFQTRAATLANVLGEPGSSLSSESERA